MEGVLVEADRGGAVDGVQRQIVQLSKQAVNIHNFRQQGVGRRRIIGGNLERRGKARTAMKTKSDISTTENGFLTGCQSLMLMEATTSFFFSVSNW
jgi:hypothetical protein